MTKQMWLHGLVAAFVGGSANMVTSGLALMLINPEQFNLGPALVHTLLSVFVLAAISGLQTAAAYLKQSPLWTETTTVTTIQKVETTKEPEVKP